MSNLATIRELCERKQFELASFMFQRYKGSIPLCCHKTRKLGEEKENYEIWCDWVGMWLSRKEFRKVCKKCQKEIEKMLEKADNDE